MIDLHTHTNISDGTLRPTELIKLAKSIGLKAVAITDHDSIDGLDEAQQTANQLGIKLIKGIEFSVTFGENRLLHILGLNIDTSSEGFLSIYLNYRRQRAQKLLPVFDELKAMGVEISTDAIQPYISGGLADRQAIAKFLVAKAYTKTVRESWVNYLDKIPYHDGELIKPEEVFKAVHAAGGKAFIAHYHLKIGFKGYTDEQTRGFLKQLKAMGLDGMEYYYPSFTEEDQLRVEDYIKQFDFKRSGGTDFHGANRPAIQLGIGKGNFHVPNEILDQIIGE